MASCPQVLAVPGCSQHTGSSPLSPPPPPKPTQGYLQSIISCPQDSTVPGCSQKHRSPHSHLPPQLRTPPLTQGYSQSTIHSPQDSTVHKQHWCPLTHPHPPTPTGVLTKYGQSSMGLGCPQAVFSNAGVHTSISTCQARQHQVSVGHHLRKVANWLTAGVRNKTNWSTAGVRNNLLVNSRCQKKD